MSLSIFILLRYQQLIPRKSTQFRQPGNTTYTHNEQCLALWYHISNSQPIPDKLTRFVVNDKV